MVNLLLVVALLGGCLFAWPNLPESIPTHFDLVGNPDGWSDKSVWSWFIPPIIALLILVMLYGLAWIIPKVPALLSIPDKDRILSLGDDERKPVFLAIQDILFWSGSLSTAVFGLIQMGAYQAAIGQGGPAYMPTALLLIVVGYPVLLIVTLKRVKEMIHRATSGIDPQPEER